MYAVVEETAKDEKRYYESIRVTGVITVVETEEEAIKICNKNEDLIGCEESHLYNFSVWEVGTWKCVFETN